MASKKKAGARRGVAWERRLKKCKVQSTSAHEQLKELLNKHQARVITRRKLHAGLKELTDGLDLLAIHVHKL